MKVLLATPTMWGLAKSAYVGTLLDTVFDLQANGIGVRYVLHDGADVTLARNLLASLFYEDITCTHAFFIDSDMQFSGSLCRRLMSLDKPVIGAAYARRSLDFATLRRYWGSDMAFEDALALAHTYTTRLSGDRVSVKDGICEVDGFGFGAALIRRDALETMVARGAARIVHDNAYTRQHGLSRGLYNFFDPLPDSSGGALAEDWSFCARWKEQCGGQVWAVVDADVGHLGDMRYGQPYFRRLRQGQI